MLFVIDNIENYLLHTWIIIPEIGISCHHSCRTVSGCLVYDQNCPKSLCNENHLMCNMDTLYIYEHKYHKCYFFGHEMFVTISNKHFCIQISNCLWNGSSGALRNYRHLFERQFWTNRSIFIRPKKLDFES